ncbi:LLM class flavin-dependent oxidoreductase [Plastoroseomonas arctica]|uniref:Luciferase-like monooxygenase n=1 Tax=Plastoroseomonas arctica TaxID=1509237 RepID=A0AAF1JV43_9PROT|nr:LLM class flavin-dependent oxidoreductase [Plastoroseomonas arctica]MBR0653453.1 LLM class flavin-dependent oxidoreductase [Plastoroseomonas arctica]
MALSLSILDQSTIAAGRDAGAAVAETLALARKADGWGYARYWLAEHHNSQAHAGSAPEILIAAIAATTRRIRVGSAGIMLPHYASLKVAEQFRALEAVAPGRIDLGVGRAPGSDGRTAMALNPMAMRQVEDRFPAQVSELLGWTGEGLPVTHPHAAITAQPAVSTRPQLWILGSSEYGAQLAAYFGLPYCFAHFITDGGGCAEALALYHAQFRADAGNLPAAHAALGVFALAADTEAEAEHLFASRALSRLLRDRGRFVPLPSPEEALAYNYTPADRSRIAQFREQAIIGTPAQVLGRLEALAGSVGAAEIAILSPCHDPVARARSYELIAREAGLAQALPIAA